MTFVPTAEQSKVLAAQPPLRIAAGAGTGKTATITRAIVERVRDGKVQADQVLGITFTNKAAAELAGRVRAELDGSTPIGVEADIHTYHGFAHRLLAEFGPLIGVERDLTVISPTYSRQILIDAITSGGPYDHLPLHNRRHLVPDLARLAGALGDNLHTADTLLANPIEDDVDRLRHEIAEVLARFEREKERLEVLDYPDLLRLAHRLLTHHPAVVSELRDRYRLVLLDEYQDTSPAQRMLLQAAFGGGFPVIAVGDADQTIYEWRGATLENFADFPTHFPTAAGTPAPSLPLSLNRRSGQLILDVANRLRSHIDESTRQDLTPIPGAPVATVTASWYRTARTEADGIADLLTGAHDEGIPWRSMAVLFRKNADISLVRQALGRAEIPAEVASIGGLLEIPEIVEVHAWLRVLDDPGDSAAFARLMLGSRYRLGMADLRPLREWARRPDEDEWGPPVSPLEAIDHVDLITDLSPGAAAALIDFRALYRHLLEAAQGVSLVELVRRVLDALGAWREIEALPAVQALSTRLNVYRFLDLAESWSPLEGRPSLPAFLDHLDLMAEDQTEELDTARISTEDAVTLLTIHRAKGLEWDVVCVPNVTDRTFPAGIQRTEDPFLFAQELPFDHRLDRSSLPPITAAMDPSERRRLMRARHEAQEWRLAYVAATRAKLALHVSGSFWYGVPEPLKTPKKPSAIFEAVATVPGVDARVLATEPGDRPVSLRPTPEPGGPDPLFGPEGWTSGARAAIARPGSLRDMAGTLGVAKEYDRAVSDFHDMLFALPEAPDDEAPFKLTSVSVTGLVTYRRCPKQFYWSEVDRLPRRPSRAARRGIEVHRRIELHHSGAVPMEDLEATEYDDPGTGVPGSAPFEAFLASPYAGRRPFLVETPFELRMGAGSIRGRVDAVYESDGWEIVDFKSGRPSADPTIEVQLEAYALAADAGALAVGRPHKISVTFVFLGDGFEQRTQVVDAAWLERARASVEGILHCIDGEEFEPRPSSYCTTCDFLRFCEEGSAWEQ